MCLAQAQLSSVSGLGSLVWMNGPRACNTSVKTPVLKEANHAEGSGMMEFRSVLGHRLDSR